MFLFLYILLTLLNIKYALLNLLVSIVKLLAYHKKFE